MGDECTPDFALRLPAALIFAVFGAVTLVVGCDSSKTGDLPPNALSAETPTALGCARSKGHYFDFRTNSCITPTSPEQLIILDKYRYVEELAASSTTLEYQIVFSRFLEPTQLSDLLGELPSKGITFLSLYFPSVDGGTTVARELPESPSSVPEAAKLLMAKITQSAGDDPSVQQAFGSGSYVVWLVRIRVDSQVVGKWWSRHDPDIRFVQPLSRDIDKIQQAPPPGVSFP